MRARDVQICPCIEVGTPGVPVPRQAGIPDQPVCVEAIADNLPISAARFSAGANIRRME